MSHDLNYAAKCVVADIERLQSALEGMTLHRDLVDLEALEMAMFDLENAKAAILLALCGKEIAH